MEPPSHEVFSRQILQQPVEFLFIYLSRGLLLVCINCSFNIYWSSVNWLFEGSCWVAKLTTTSKYSKTSKPRAITCDIETRDWTIHMKNLWFVSVIIFMSRQKPSIRLKTALNLHITPNFLTVFQDNHRLEVIIAWYCSWEKLKSISSQWDKMVRTLEIMELKRKAVEIALNFSITPNCWSKTV